MRLATGTRLGSCEIMDLLGAGGMGEVYRARDARLDRLIAVKVLPARLANDGAALARFEREARAVAALSHPNILSIFDVGREQDTAYAVMELLEGTTLRQALQGPLPMRKALDYGPGHQPGSRRAVLEPRQPRTVLSNPDRVAAERCHRSG
jgi:serine/threonine protein kinase